MTARILATADPVNRPPRMLLQVSGLSGSTVTVNRMDPVGNVSPVRTANPAPLVSGGVWVGYDYAAPYNVPVTYWATSDTGATASARPKTVPVGVPWLVHPGIPDLSCPLDVISRGDRTRTTNSAVHKPLGRKYPIVVSDGVRSASTFDLLVRTEDLETEDDLEELLDDSSPLLLQITWTEIRRAYYGWVSIGDVTQADLTDYWGVEIVQWTLPCTETAEPAGLQQAQRTLGSLAAQFGTLGEIAAAYQTLRDVTLDRLIGA